MTIFDYLKDIVVTKSGTLPLDNYVPFLVNRWLSFINPEVCLAINQANSKTLLEDKLLHYKLMLSLFPKLKYIPKIKYVKKIKEELDNANASKIKILAENLEISQKEASVLFNS